MTTAHHPRRSVLGALLVVALGAAFGAACDPKSGTGSAGPGSSASPTPNDTSRPAKGPEEPASPSSGREYTIAWSVWTGWMPFKLMEQKGFLATRAKENGVKIKLQEFKGYMDSVQAFAAQKVDGCAMTSMESLQPASNGVDSVAIIVNDTSNGGDGVLVRGNLDLKGLKQRLEFEAELERSSGRTCHAHGA